MARSRRLVVLAVLVCALAAGCATSETGVPPGPAEDGQVADSSGAPGQDSSSGSDANSGADTTVGDDSGSTTQDGGAMIDTAGDAPDETGSLADAAAPDSAAPDGTGVPTDSASMDALGDSNGGQDVSNSDATDASVDASEAGADAGDSGSDGSDAPSDASDAGSDASDARSDASDAADAGPKCVSNVLTPTAAVSLSVNGANNVAHNAIDGIFTTRWESVHAVDPQWIYLDFGAPVFVDHVQIAWETACATNYDIQVSNDATAWTTLRSIVGNTLGGPAPADWTTAADHAGLSGVGRYLRINGTVRCGMYGYSIWEMRAFGDTNSTCHP